MDIGINVSSSEITKLQVENIITLLDRVNYNNFGDKVAITALKLLNKTASQPIHISDVNLVGEQKFYKGSTNVNASANWTRVSGLT